MHLGEYARVRRRYLAEGVDHPHPRRVWSKIIMLPNPLYSYSVRVCGFLVYCLLLPFLDLRRECNPSVTVFVSVLLRPNELFLFLVVFAPRYTKHVIHNLRFFHGDDLSVSLPGCCHRTTARRQQRNTTYGFNKTKIHDDNLSPFPCTKTPP